MSIDSLLELIVERDSEITGRQIAEALWFMLAIKHSQESEADARGQLSVPSTTRVVPSLPSTIQQSEQPLPLMGQEETRSTPTMNQPDLPDTISTSEQSQAALYPLGAKTFKETAARITPLRVPSVGALPNAASIARALRPLRRRVPSRHRIRLDEKVTAERSAEENTLVPVMLPAQSRWLALHLVVDQGGSATIWQDTIQELHRLLIRQGAFRDIRLWQFDSDSDDKELLLFAGRTSTIPRRASELSDPEGRHLVLIVSDCVGRAWHDGRTTTALSLWSNSSPMALFQLMPPQLWDRTALGREIEVHLKASAAGAPNTRLISTPVDEWEDVLPTKKVLTPVVTLTTEAIKAWVNLLIGRPGNVVSGHAFDRVAKSSHLNRPSDLTPSPSQRVQRFLSLSTPTAQRLALLASAAPVTLPILNLLCATFLPMADQSHVAELLLSGLLYRTSSDVSREPDAVLYEFYDGVRDLLLELAPFKQSSEVVARVSAYLEERAEHEREMRALLALPGDTGITNLPETLPFARVRAMLLKGLGYTRLADIIEETTVPVRKGQVDADDTSAQDANNNSLVELQTETSYEHADQQGVMKSFFDGIPGDKEYNLMNEYLRFLTLEMDNLRLQRLSGRSQLGSDQTTLPPLGLSDIYTELMTDGPEIVVHKITGSASFIEQQLDHELGKPASQDAFPPEQIRNYSLKAVHSQYTDSYDDWLAEKWTYGNKISFITQGLDYELYVTRPELVVEAIRSNRRLVVLGQPGSGKSTVLRYLTLFLAHKLLGSSNTILSWPDNLMLVPIYVSLGQILGKMVSPTSDAYQALMQVLTDKLDGSGFKSGSGLGRYLGAALRNGRLLLLLDGLDEVFSESDNQIRRKVASAIRTLAAGSNCHIVVTSRSIPYSSAGDWQMPPEEGWAIRSLKPLTFGQIRTIVTNWHKTLAKQSSAAEVNAEESAALIDALKIRPELDLFAQSPLLLTMLLVLYSQHHKLPEDRVQLYEDFLQLLLIRWEPVRTPEFRQVDMLQRLSGDINVSINDLRAFFHRLALEVHLQAADGRGVIRGSQLRQELMNFLSRFRVDHIEQRIQTFLAVVREQSGLLVQVGDDEYSFPHLVIQEYLAACALADDINFISRSYSVWSGADRDRWREVLLLVMGRLRQQAKNESTGLPWLRALLESQTPSGESKTPTQRYHDTVLAVLGFIELDIPGLRSSNFGNLESTIIIPLRQAIIEMLLEPRSTVSTFDRITTAQVLGAIGDTRFPTSLSEWSAELRRLDTDFALTSSYFCYIPAGRYQVGGWEKDSRSADIDISTFWIGRFPITVAQYVAFVEEGYTKDAATWWTLNGWRWKDSELKYTPFRWQEQTKQSSNVPVTGITWYEATAFCKWLNSQLINKLPEGYAIRLPTEAEWEIAAVYDSSHRRRPYPWGQEEPTSEHAVYEVIGLNQPAAVGCFAAGRAACGAFDMAGNVWELTASSYREYPVRSAVYHQDFSIEEGEVAWRGGSYKAGRTLLHSGSRLWYPADYIGENLSGFRVVLAPLHNSNT